MIAAGQQFAAAACNSIVHLAFLSAEGEWHLACDDELAQLQGQDPVLTCATCEEIAHEEVAGDPVAPGTLDELLEATPLGYHDLALLAGVA